MTNKEIFEAIDNIVLRELMTCDDMMKYAQSYGYNGFKRMFRVLSKEFYCWHIELENNYFDYFRDILNTKVEVNSISLVGIKTIIEMSRNMFKDDITRLGDLNKRYYELNGVECSVIKNIIDCLLHKFEKTSRWLERFNESNWNVIDIHLVDDRLHEKIKKYEEEHK